MLASIPQGNHIFLAWLRVASTANHSDPGIIATAEQLNELRSRVKALEDFVLSTKLPQAESGAERPIARVLIDMENYLRTLVDAILHSERQESRSP